jgi:F-type H+/Na+-transporting ATPase subunit alpha
MALKSSDLVSLFERALSSLPEDTLDIIGIVVQAGDGICKVHGLRNVVFGELVTFEGGNRGMVFQINDDAVDVFLIDNVIPVVEREVVRCTGSVYAIPVSSDLLGRVVNAQALPLDGLGDITPEAYHPVEVAVPGIMERTPVNRSLETGIMAIDTLVPIGRGQRELIIGNRGAGKTMLVIDTIVHQKDQNVICIYVAIGQRQANVARLVRYFEEQNALAHTVIVSAQAGEAVLNQYLAPYVGCTIGEYFRDQGKDVLIIYDDLSNHAIAFREMSLLLRRAPGREAYPGDVFFLHSRLLERAGNMAKGGSLTALPLVQIQGDDITSYIPTNLISITDGQIFLDTKLFNRGIRPAVNAELSVSRVGSAAQTAAIKKVTKSFRLELAQYQELRGFAQFGAELDEVSKKRLARGERAIALLKQPEHVTYSFVDQTLMLFLLQERILDPLSVDQVLMFATQFVSYITSVYSDLYNGIKESRDLSDATRAELKKIATDFSALFITPPPRSGIQGSW